MSGQSFVRLNIALDMSQGRELAYCVEGMFLLVVRLVNHLM